MSDPFRQRLGFREFEIGGEKVRAFEATYLKMDSLPKSGLSRVVLEIPVQHHVQVTQMLGNPDPSISTHCLVVVMGTFEKYDFKEKEKNNVGQTSVSPVSSAQESVPETQEASEKAEQDKEAPQGQVAQGEGKPETPLVTKIAMACGDPRFQKFLQDDFKIDEPIDKDAAAVIVRRACGVASRKDIEGNKEAMEQ